MHCTLLHLSLAVLLTIIGAELKKPSVHFNTKKFLKIRHKSTDDYCHVIVVQNQNGILPKMLSVGEQPH